MALPPPKQLLERFGLRPKHSFGQNFLSDAHLAGKIADLLGKEPLTVLEIGAGLGALTDELLSRQHSVTAVERDRDLVPALSQLFSEPLAQGRLELLEADAKGLDWTACLARRSGVDASQAFQVRPPLQRSWALSGNLPYQITGPLLEKTVMMAEQIRVAAYLVQKEVADRLAAQPGSKTYGALSVFVQAQFAVERAFVIKPGAFVPKPGVDSAVVVLRSREEPISRETPMFRRVVKGAFSARRKTLRNAWRSVASPEILSEAAKRCDIDLDKRGETLDVSAFARLATYLDVLETK